jgi:adenosine deaminase
MFALAERNGVMKELSYSSPQEARHAREHFSNLSSFLDLYYQGLAATPPEKRVHSLNLSPAGAKVLREEADFYDLTRAYLTKARTQGLVHAEIFVDPQTHILRGIACHTVFQGECVKP